MKTHWIPPGFSRVEVQLEPKLVMNSFFGIPAASAAWSFSFGLFRSKERPGGLNLKLHAAEADGVCDHLSAIH